MLRNSFVVHYKAQYGGKYIFTNVQFMLKSTNSVNSSIHRQGKIISKLFGNRVSGSKKRWYPTTNASTSNDIITPSVVFHGSRFDKSNSGNSIVTRGGGNGKNVTRRISVLNKLFMAHITDLLATGEASEYIVGRSMQVSRVKITSDFACMNVYWLGSGDVLADAKLEVELQRCSGILRHEFSQLRLMGEVPRIRFVRDRYGENINQIEDILRNFDFEKLDNILIDEEQTRRQQTPYASFDIAQTVRSVFYGGDSKQRTPAPQPQVVSNKYKLPEMRQDVLGLDHRYIMTKVLTKMRKTRQAWEEHKETSSTTASDVGKDTPAVLVAKTNTELALVQHKLTKAAECADKFDAFLAKRLERKQTPKRKKQHRENNWSLAENTTNADAAATEELAALLQQQCQLYHEEDYILEGEQQRHLKRKN